MPLPLRLFVLCCGFTPLVVVISHIHEILALMPSPLVPMGMIFAFAALAGGCIHVLFGEYLAPATPPGRAGRSVA